MYERHLNIRHSSNDVNEALEVELKKVNINSENENRFVRSVYNSGDIDKYRQRIYSIGFISLDGPVLDAGCGFGQWSIALSECNKSVIGIDLDKTRLAVCRGVADRLSINNISFLESSISCEAFEENTIEAIFCYSSIMLTPWRDTLVSFHRVLRNGGLLYFNAYDIGWIINNIVNQHNSTADFDSRMWGIETINNTIKYLHTNKFSQRSLKDSLYMPLSIVKEDLTTVGFECLSAVGEGCTKMMPGSISLPFAAEQLYGQNALFEILARKK